MQTRSAVRRRRTGQVLLALAVLSIGLTIAVGAIFDVVLPLYVTSTVIVALVLVGMALITRGDRFYDRGFDGSGDAKSPDTPTDRRKGD